MSMSPFPSRITKKYFLSLHSHSSLNKVFFSLLNRYGGTQAATFCCLKTLWHQLNFEGGTDVFQTAKLYHYSRPGIWKTKVRGKLEKVTV